MHARAMSALTLIAAGALAPAATAEIIRFTFTGTITSLGSGITPPEGIVLGAAYTYQYDFDSTVADTDGAPNFGHYPAVLSGLIQVGVFSRTEGAGEITALDNGFAGDTYTGRSNHPLGFTQVGLTDFQRGAFFNDSLPTDLLFDAFDSRILTIHGDQGPASWEVTGSVTSFSREVVPAPGALVLAALGTLLAARRRR